MLAPAAKSGTIGCMRIQIKNMWPLPALLAWALAWAIFLGTSTVLPWWGAAILAAAAGTLASLWGGTWWRRVLIAAGFPLIFMALSADALPAWSWLLPLVFLLLVYPLNAWRDAPVFPTPGGALDGLAAHLVMAPDARILDAGCGMGDGLKALRRAWPHAQFHGIEWSWPLRWLCAWRCPWAKVRQGDIWAADWSSYDMVYLFQRPESMTRAAVKSLGEMRAGAWLVSLNFPIPEVVPHVVCELDDGREVYAYQAPLAEVDHDSVQASEVASMFAQRPQGIVVQGQRLYPRRVRPGWHVR